MIAWVGLAVFSQLLTALVVLVDKFVLASNEHIGKPVVYAFYVALLSGFVIVLLPFGVVDAPSAKVLFYSFVGSITFVLAILHLYSALKAGHASDAVPISGAVAAITTAVFASVFVSDDLPRAFIPAFMLLVIGTFLIAHFRFRSVTFLRVVVAGFFFGAAAVATKLVFNETDFLDGFFWSRMTNVAVALFLLVVPAHRQAIFHGYQKSGKGAKFLVVGNKIVGGISGFLYLLAISWGSVSIVQALSGLQFAFVLMFVYLGSFVYPKVFAGEIHKHHFPHQIYGVITISAGLAVLFIV